MAMARIVLGNRDGALALRQARDVLELLTDEWPDVNFALRTIKQAGSGRDASAGSDALLRALVDGDVAVAVAQLETLPLVLPEGVTLAAVAKRLEPRTALLGKAVRSLAELPQGGHVGVLSERDGAYLRGQRADLNALVLDGTLEADLKLLAAGEVEALLLPAAMLLALDHRNRLDVVLEPEAFAPAPGQGALGLLVRADDDPAFEVAYSLQHRPSFDRVRAERSFAHTLANGAPAPDRIVGALANVTEDGELTLFGAVLQGGTTLQASVSGEAKEAEEIGRELAQDVHSQLATL